MRPAIRLRPATVVLLGGLAAIAAGMLLVSRWRRLPNVVLVVADTLRADRLGVYGDRDGLTPFLDEVAARGTVFTHAYATSSWTCPSVASLFTSRYPSQHHVTDFDSKLPADEVTLAELLAGRHYVGAGFLANWRLTRNLGYGQGFTGFLPFWSPGHKVTADRLARKSFRWLDRSWSVWMRRPLFLYYHLMETHAPYDPARESHGHTAADVALRRRFGLDGDEAAGTEANTLLRTLRWRELGADQVTVLESLYDAEAASLDNRLRGLFAELDRRGILRNAIVVFTADHGEEFRDHGQFLHGTSLFNELIRVPLIMVVPGRPGGRVVEENVSLVDVAPTVLALLGLPAERRFEGRSLTPLLAGARQPADVLAELLPTREGHDKSRHVLAFVRGDVKLLLPRGAADDGASVLYDLAADPYETQPNPPALAPQRGAYAAMARRAASALQGRAGAPEQGYVDATTRARLRALGYTQ